MCSSDLGQKFTIPPIPDKKKIVEMGDAEEKNKESDAEKIEDTGK